MSLFENGLPDACLDVSGVSSVVRHQRRSQEGIWTERCYIMLCSYDEFKALVDEREPKMLRAFTSMEVNVAGGLEQKSIKGAEFHAELRTLFAPPCTAL